LAVLALSLREGRENGGVLQILLTMTFVLNKMELVPSKMFLLVMQLILMHMFDVLLAFTLELLAELDIFALDTLKLLAELGIFALDLSVTRNHVPDSGRSERGRRHGCQGQRCKRGSFKTQRQWRR